MSDAKPAFDPTKPFEVSKKPAFDPTKPFDAAGSSPSQQGIADRAFSAIESVTDPIGGAAAGALGLVKPVFDVVNRYGANPIRKGILSLQEGRGVKQSLSDASDAFGAEDESPVSGKQIAEKAGISSKPVSDYLPEIFSDTGEGWRLRKGGLLDVSPAGVAGGVVDVATDPTTYVGAGLLKKGVSGAAGVAEQIAPKTAAAIKQGAGKIANVASKVTSAVTGVPKRELEVLAKRSDEVLDLAKRHNNNIASATDSMRSKWSSQIGKAKNEINERISSAISKADATPVDVSGVVKRLQEVKSKLHPQYGADDIAEIDGLLKTISEAGEHDLGAFYDLKKHLRDVSKGSYKKGGQIFVPGKAFQRAAKNAANEASGVLESIAPEIAKADKSLSQLHQIESRLNKNVLKEGASNASILAAGNESNQFQRGLLRKLGDITKSDLVRDAENLASANTFASPSMLPLGETGKVVARGMLGAGIGSLAGPAGAMAGGLLSNPMAAKLGILGAKKAGKAINAGSRAVLPLSIYNNLSKGE